jgi:hypothetical protein
MVIEFASRSPLGDFSRPGRMTDRPWFESGRVHTLYNLQTGGLSTRSFSIEGDQVVGQPKSACSEETTLRQRPTTICLDSCPGIRGIAR